MISTENTKQWQQQMQSQFLRKIQNNDNNKCNHNFYGKYKQMTTTNAITISTEIQNNHNNKCNHNFYGKYKTMTTINAITIFTENTKQSQQTNAITISTENTKQGQQQMQTQFLQKIQNNGNNKCNHHFYWKYKITTTNAITFFTGNTKELQKQMQSQVIPKVQNNGNNKCNHNFYWKYKTMTTANAITISTGNVKYLKDLNLKAVQFEYIENLRGRKSRNLSIFPTTWLVIASTTAHSEWGQ